MEFQIESTRHSRYIRHKYPFEQMQVDDSFFVPCGTVSIASLRGAAYKFGKRWCRQYQVRAAEDDGKPGMRVWRTA